MDCAESPPVSATSDPFTMTKHLKPPVVANIPTEEDNGSSQLHGSRLESNTYNFLWTWVLIIVSVAWITFTIYFAYNCTLPNPPSPKLVLSNPSNTLLVLNILSHGAIQLLKELMSSAFEAVRWALASTSSGIPAYTFLGLSRATGPLGVSVLLFWNTSIHDRRSGHRFWTSQR